VPRALGSSAYASGSRRLGCSAHNLRAIPHHYQKTRLPRLMECSKGDLFFFSRAGLGCG